MALSVLSLNVNGLRDSTKRGGLWQWLCSVNWSVDVVCLQETHCISEVACCSSFLYSGLNFVVSPGSNHSCGCIVLFRLVLDLVKFHITSLAIPSFVISRFTTYPFVFCLYAPNRNPARDLFLNQMCDIADPSIPTIVCGDFHTVFDHSLDCCGSSVDVTS